MKALMVAQFKYSDTIIFNRCDESTDKLFLRRCVKPVNRKGQIIYESAEGVTDDAGEEALPFDLEASVIEIQEEDYGPQKVFLLKLVISSIFPFHFLT